jgi:hypothetical protein
VASPSPSQGETFEFMYVHGSSVHKKCSNYTLTNLLFGLCRFMWIIDPFVIHSNPHLGAPTHPFTPKMLWTMDCTPTYYPFVVFTFGLVVDFIKEFGGASQIVKLTHMTSSQIISLQSNFSWILLCVIIIHSEFWWVFSLYYLFCY